MNNKEPKIHEEEVNSWILLLETPATNNEIIFRKI